MASRRVSFALPTAFALDAGAKVTAEEFHKYGIHPLRNDAILGHRDVDPGNECPGQELYDYLPIFRWMVFNHYVTLVKEEFGAGLESSGLPTVLPVG